MSHIQSDAYVLLDDQFTIILANDVFAGTFPVIPGTQVREGQNLLQLVASPLKEQIEANVQTALQGSEVKIEYEVSTPQSEKVYAISHYPLKRKEKVTGIFITIQDITQSKKAEQNLTSLLKRYNLAISAVKMGIWEINVATGMVHWDDNLYHLFELDSRTPVTIEYWQSFIHPQDAADVMATFYKSIENKVSEVNLNFRIITAKGREKNVVSKMLLLSDEEGKITRIIGANWDNTEEQKAKEKLQQSESKMRVLLRSTQDGFFLLDKEGYTVLLNEEAKIVLKEIHGAEVKEGDYLLDKILPQSKERVKSAIDAVLNGERLEYEASFVSQGKERWFISIYTPAHNEKDEIEGVAIISREITERKQVELQQQALLQRYNLVTSAVKMGTFERDVVTNKLTGDENLYKLFEVPPSTPFTWKLFKSLLHPEDKQRVLQGIKKAEESKASEITQEFRIITPQGHEKSIFNKTLYLSEKNGNFSRTMGCNWDITDQQKAKEALEESERKTRALLQSTREGFYLYDTGLCLILINEQGSRFAQMRSGKIPVLGQHVSEFTRPDEIESVLKILNEVLTGRSLEVERNVPTQNGPIWLHLTYNPVKEQEEIKGVSIVVRDVTELVHSRENLVAARQRAEQSEQLQEQFLANMSHEIRTPLNGIVGMGHLLLNTPLNDQQRKYLQTILHSSDSLLFLINDILDLSKIKAGKIKIEKIEMNIHQVVEEVTAPFRAKAQTKGIRFSAMMDPFIPKNLSGDPHRLMQILNNLLSNAVKFTENGFVKLEVEVTGNEGNIVTLDFAVSDSGIGIEEDQLQFVFESFAQEGTDTARKFGGSGLGLAITKRLVELQGGSVSVTSAKGKGSRFVVRLPYQEIDETKATEAAARVEPDEKKIMNFSGKRVLVVEDNEINQQVFAHMLKDYGIHTTVVNNGKKAVQLLEEGAAFDLILLDLRMPEMDGFQTLAYMRQKLKIDTPTIVLTASVLRDERQRCLELGADDYQSKPIPRPLLQQCLNHFLREEKASASQKEPAPASEKKTPEIDLKMLSSLSDKKIINDIYTKYLETVPVLLEEMKATSAEGNWNQLREQAHKLKNSLHLINIKELTGLITEVEEKARSKQGTEGILPAIEQGIQIYYDALPTIEEQINSVLL